jgi:hypothetical protein
LVLIAPLGTFNLTGSAVATANSPAAQSSDDDDTPDPPEIDDDPTPEPTEEVDPPTPPEEGEGDDDDDPNASSSASDGNSYTDDANGWSITWDDSWKQTADPGKDGYLALDNGTSSVLASVLANTTDARDCVGDQVLLLVNGDATSSVSRLLQSGDAVRGGDETAAYGAYRYNFKTENASIKMISYFDCRILPSGDEALLISLLVVQGSYADEAEGFQTLLDGVTIGDD